MADLSSHLSLWLPLLGLLLSPPSGSSLVTAATAVIPYHHTVPDLPLPNLLATMGNPLKGLVGGSRWSTPPLRHDIVPHSMEFFNVGVSSSSDTDGPDHYVCVGLLPTPLRPNISRHRRLSIFTYRSMIPWLLIFTIAR
jgi:hypothetical protein